MSVQKSAQGGSFLAVIEKSFYDSIGNLPISLETPGIATAAALAGFLIGKLVTGRMRILL